MPHPIARPPFPPNAPTREQITAEQNLGATRHQRTLATSGFLRGTALVPYIIIELLGRSSGTDGCSLLLLLASHRTATLVCKISVPRYKQLTPGLHSLIRVHCARDRARQICLCLYSSDSGGKSTRVVVARGGARARKSNTKDDVQYREARALS